MSREIDEFDLALTKLGKWIAIGISIITILIFTHTTFMGYLDFIVSNKKVVLFYDLMGDIVNTVESWLNTIISIFNRN